MGWIGQPLGTEGEGQARQRARPGAGVAHSPTREGEGASQDGARLPVWMVGACGASKKGRDIGEKAGRRKVNFMTSKMYECVVMNDLLFLS